MGEGPGSHMPVSEAFRCHGANQLPNTKFIGRGLFIKYLGQVDLPGAPLKHRSQASLSSVPLPVSSWFWMYRGVWLEECSFGLIDQYNMKRFW